jgi:hypothetical protein
MPSYRHVQLSAQIMLTVVAQMQKAAYPHVAPVMTALPVASAQRSHSRREVHAGLDHRCVRCRCGPRRRAHPRLRGRAPQAHRVTAIDTFKSRAPAAIIRRPAPMNLIVGMAGCCARPHGPAGLVSRFSSTSMSRLSVPCARMSLEAAKCREVPSMRPVAPKAVMH